jgi:hypothetical protein
VRGALVVVSQKSFGAWRDHSPFVILAGEYFYREDIGELGDRHKLDLAVCRLASQ